MAGLRKPIQNQNCGVPLGWGKIGKEVHRQGLYHSQQLPVPHIIVTLSRTELLRKESAGAEFRWHPNAVIARAFKRLKALSASADHRKRTSPPFSNEYRQYKKSANANFEPHVSEEKVTAQRTFTLSDVFNSSIRARSYNMRWISDPEYLHEKDGSIFLHNLITGNNSEFLSSITFDQVAAYDYVVSADQKYVAFKSNWTKIWRHSFTASYSLYDFAGSTFLSTPDIPHQVHLFAWAPTGNKMAFVWENDVYVKTSPTAKAIQVTSNGKHNKILNGIPDWVYEEEMFSSYEAMWLPGGKYLAYAEFNDTLVQNIEYSWYGKEQYPDTVIFPYPTPGTPKPVVKLFVYDITNISNITEVVVPASVGARYAGPCSQKADFRYRLGWAAYLASTEKVIVASFDGQGAGSGVFKCGMAVAPVSKWDYYDTIYTERYMNQPSENLEFYNNSTVTARAKNFKSVQCLLVHGTADDNVHFQQAAQISAALVEEQVDFEAMWYTDKDHGHDGSANQHVYTHMSHFLQSCFA
ncbi:dipeptidyl peptidase 4-like [Salvelinus namaycush]|uniref:Dipeptidyl peptidase 4-like n=1 Tax=Salvelinus namaycush TaxID=8040 RepID=A0A8U0UGW4_SALNM|nr:dipeptidyl peptidase 4-like [Salvelinus namaycush]